MRARFDSGHVAGIPYGRTIVDIDSADIATVITAATGLVLTVGGLALAGAAAYAAVSLLNGILSALLEGLGSRSNKPKEIRLPLGSAPCWIEASGGNFWGVILDREIHISVEGRPLTLAFPNILNLEFKSGIFMKNWMNISLIDGSNYHGSFPDYGAVPISESITVASLGGTQVLPVFSFREDSFLFWEWIEKSGLNSMKFKGSVVTDETVIREGLKTTISEHAPTITKLLTE